MDKAPGTAKEPVGDKGASEVKVGSLEPRGSERSSGVHGQVRPWGSVKNVGMAVCFALVLGVQFKAPCVWRSISPVQE